MATSDRPGPNEPSEESAGATEPITLTDPDGAVTRVAPWSSWTREQVRAPGGEPALVTRLDQGQLWFSAGRRRSPWRHEVHVGPAVVSTPRGRFQAIAEADGGATVACLAGRTRVVAGLREPVLLGPDQSAAVSADGRTLVVMDRTDAEGAPQPVVIDLTDQPEVVVDEPAEAPVAEFASSVPAATTPTPAIEGAAAAALLDAVFTETTGEQPPAAGGDDGGDDDALPYAEDDGERRSARLGWIPELVAVAALVGLLVAGIWVFTKDSRSGEQTASPAPTTEPVTTEAPSTTAAPTTAAPTTVVPTTEAPATTAAPTTTSPPSASGATATGELVSCRRSGGGVIATISLQHRSGPASRFRASAGLVDANGEQFAESTADSARIEPGGSGQVEVAVPVDGDISGSCELGSIVAI